MGQENVRKSHNANSRDSVGQHYSTMSDHTLVFYRKKDDKGKFVRVKKRSIKMSGINLLM